MTCGECFWFKAGNLPEGLAELGAAGKCDGGMDGSYVGAAQWCDHFLQREPQDPR
jgi:hypothetical protein